MRKLPILFKAAMVRAILREIEQPGTGKTQTRRVLTPQPEPDMDIIGLYAPRLTAVFGYVTPDAGCKIPLRYIPGDRLYVREAWRTLVAHDAEPPRDLPPHMTKITYEADRRKADGWVWGKLRRAMHMPRWASRITLIVTEVRVQRLQEISREDAIAEGLHLASNQIEEFWRWPPPHDDRLWLSPVAAYQWLWDSLNVDRGYGWDVNPWVAAYTFRPILGDVDHQVVKEAR